MPNVRTESRSPRRRSIVGTFAAVVCLSQFASTSFGVTATIHKTDDTTVVGNVTSFENGKLTIATAPKPTAVSLDEISQVVFRDPPAAKPPTLPPADASVAADNSPSVAGSVLSAFFGSGHSNGNAPAQPPTPPPAVKPKPAKPPTSGPAAMLTAKFSLTDGDVLRGTLQAWADQKLTVKLAAAGNDPVQFPSTAVSEIWAGNADLMAKAKALTVEPGPEDVAFVQKDADVVAVKGLVLGVDASSLLFRFGDQDRKIGLGKIVGILLRGNPVKPVDGFHQLFKTDSGEAISGQWTGISGDNAELTAPFGAAMKLPLASLYTVDFLNGRVVYVSDLTPTKIEQTPYFGRLIPYRVDHGPAGGPLVLSDGTYNKGIAVHSRCVLSFDVPGEFERFKTKLGFEIPAGLHGRVVARATGDGKTLYENLDARGDQKPVDIDLDMTHVRTLTLEIDFGNDQDVGDRVVWAMPRLLRSKLPK